MFDWGQEVETDGHEMVDVCTSHAYKKQRAISLPCAEGCWLFVEAIWT